jgi:nucleotide-binding universal stress UspA family protein
MYKKILVPLDGSKLAECALPHVEELAKCFNIEEVILVSVTERVQGYRVFDDPKQLQGQRLILEDVGKKQEQAERYLIRISKKLTAKGIKVDTEVLFWPPAEAIISYAEHNAVDLIVMCSHGHSGLTRWAFGSVADKVLRGSHIPVLVVRAPGSSPSI